MANVTPIYDVKSERVLTEGALFVKALKEKYLGDFNRFMPSLFNEEFVIDLNDALDEALKIGSDDFIIQLQAKESADVYLVRSNSGFAVRLLNVYASKVFHDQPAILNTFKFKAFRKIRNNTEEVISYLRNLIEVVERHHEALLAGDLPQDMLGNLRNLYASLKKERLEQLAIMDDREVITVQRIKAHNHVWELMSELSSVREFVFPDDVAKQDIFRLPQPESYGNSVTNEEIVIEE